MRRSLLRLLCALVLGLGAIPALAGDIALPEQDRSAIRAVIAAQIDAFRNDDAERAFSFASNDIRAMFVTADNFMRMVREGYAPVYRPQRYRFTRLLQQQGRLLQLVAIVGSDGRAVTAIYELQRQPDGQWRIAGCQLVVAEDNSA